MSGAVFSCTANSSPKRYSDAETTEILRHTGSDKLSNLTAERFLADFADQSPPCACCHRRQRARRRRGADTVAGQDRLCCIWVKSEAMDAENLAKIRDVELVKLFAVTSTSTLTRRAKQVLAELQRRGYLYDLVRKDVVTCEQWNVRNSHTAPINCAEHAKRVGC